MQREGRVKIAPSILTADFTRLGEQVQSALEAGAEAIHADVIDGHYAPNLTFGPLVVAALSPLTRATGAMLEAHLMVEKPEGLFPALADAGADLLTVHVETCPHLHGTIQQIKELGLKAGVTLNPATPLVSLEEILPEVDLVLVMSVNPGFGGQEYIPGSTARIRRLREMLNERGLFQVDLEVDGGIKAANASEVVRAGANKLVVGSEIFNERLSVAESMAAMRKAMDWPVSPA
jgi:ribulose-phosphate 3-epimerase